MKALHLCLASCLALLLVAGSALAQKEKDKDKDKPKAKDLIVGVWKGKDKVGDKEIEMTMEFTKDGALKMEMMGLKIDGKYKFADDNNVEVEFSLGGQTIKQKLKVEATKDKLSMTDEKGMKNEFTRSK